MRRIYSLILFGFLLLWSSASMAQQSPAPNTKINNQANGYYFVPASKDTLFAKSNKLTAIVQAKESISITPGHVIKKRAGQQVSFTHTLTNTGNISSTITISAANSTDDDFDYTDILLSEAGSEPVNSVVAKPASQPVGGSSLTTTLNPGESYSFQVSAMLQNSFKAGDIGKLIVKAKTKQHKATAQSTSSIQVLQGPNIDIQKKTLQQDAEAGSKLTYQIKGENSGDQTARSFNVNIDGNVQNKVIVRDKIPANTTFKQSGYSDGGQPLYHIIGESDYNYASQPPADLSKIDEFAVAFDSLEAGQQFDIKFDVTVNENAAGILSNTAQINFSDPLKNKATSGSTNKPESAKTNTVQSQLPKVSAEMHYYTDDSYTDTTSAAQAGDDIRLQASAAACNANFARPDTSSITLISNKTGETETFEAVETGPNTGYFRILPSMPSRSSRNYSITKNNNIWEATSNEVVTATLPQCGKRQKSAQANITMDPHGIVFNSKNGEPVTGAKVTLIDVSGNGNGGNAGAPAEVLGKNGQKKADNPQRTDQNGRFVFPHVKPSTYRIKVEPPAGYRFASTLSAGKLPAGRSVDQQLSYGKEFTISGQPQAITADVPVDPAPKSVLRIKKESSSSSAAIGDFVNYTIKVSNTTSSSVKEVRVEDTLPFGFRYEKGTALLDDNSITDPKGDQGPSLSFDIGDIPANKTVTLSYRTLLGTGAMKGNGKNTAVAISDYDLTIESNQAQHKIDVRGGVFTDKGYIIGIIFSDCNENGVQDPGEPGVPGVRLYLENGSYVITDGNGQYTFYGINPNKHVLKVDNYSLPKGAKLGVLDNRHAEDPSSRFVDLKKGQMHRADFAICNCNELIEQEIQSRKDKYSNNQNSELGQSIEGKFNVDPNRNRNNVKRAKAGGTLNKGKAPDITSSTTSVSGSQAVSVDSVIADAPDTSDSTKIDTTSAMGGRELEKAMVHEEAELGFMNISDEDTLQTTRPRIWIKGKTGSKISLKANGQEVSSDRISKKSTLSQLKLQAREYIGVPLEAGKNTLTIIKKDPFGNKRGSKTVTVMVPGSVAHIDLSVPVNNVPANGSSAAIIDVTLRDKDGVQVASKIPITLDVSIGKWKVRDNDPSTPGTQTSIRGGHRRIELKSPLKPQDAKVRVSIGTMEAESTVSFLPDLRPLIAAGIVEGTIRLNDGASIVPAHSADGFERELKTLSYKTGNATADARAAFFIKGKIKGNMLLTAGFDSEKDDDELYRDIQPDEFYPVYGESSVKGYDAQSTGRLYVRVDHKKTYALYGDFRTQGRSEAKSLGEYNRTQTGVKLHYEKDRIKLNAFGNQASSLQRIEEFRGKGISGPYELKSDNILANSEQVEIITRDRNQPSLVLERNKLQRFRDYVIEPFTGNLLFNAPVRSADKDLNPIFIRVSYEVQDGGEDYWMAGADGEFKLTDDIKIGGAFVEDRNPENSYRLKSLNTTVDIGSNTRIIGEIAESTTELDGRGRGGRFELKHRGDRIDGRVYAGQTNDDFVNRYSQIGRARTEAGAKGSIRLNDKTDIKAELIYSSNDTLNNSTTGGLLNLQHQFNKDIRGEVGMRYSDQNRSSSGPAGSQDITNKNIRSKLTVSIPRVKNASVFGEYEQDVTEWERRVIAAGGDYSFKNHGRIYARHEFASSARGQYDLNSGKKRQNTVVGLESNYMQNGKVYSEYRVNDAFDGSNAEAAIGLRNRFEIREGFGITAGLERIFSISGDPRNEGTSISTAVDYTADPMWKATARAEARFGNNANNYLNSLGYGRKINENWTFLGKNIFSLQTSSSSANRIQQRLRFGFAYRQANQNRWDGLSRYELKYQKNGEQGGTYDRLVHIFSTNMNFHPNVDWTHSARFSAKKVGESSANFDSNSLTMLLSARSMYDITKKLDGGVNASIMSDAGFDSRDYGAGVEVGYVVKRNLRVAVGFNVFGFSDRDLAASKYTRKGVYLGFSYKFDERLFRGLTPKASHHEELYAQCNECSNPEPKQTEEILSLSEPDVDLSALSGVQPIELQALPLDMKEQKPLTTLPKDIHFASNKSSLSKESKKMLRLVAEFLNKQETFKLQITGHTDSRASYKYNLGLSKRRAKSVRQYLVSQGVDKSSVQFQGLSKVLTGTDAETSIVTQALNRRVELDFDIPNANVRFIPQLNDLQIEGSRQVPSEKLDYVFDTNINVVPDRIYLAGDSLSVVTRYLLRRVSSALNYYPAAKATFLVHKENSESEQQLIKSFLQEIGTDMGRVNIQPDSVGLTDNNAVRVMIAYNGEPRLEPNTDKHYLKFRDSNKLNNLILELQPLLKEREDYLLINNDN